jgi:hypothetical protein
MPGPAVGQPNTTGHTPRRPTAANGATLAVAALTNGLSLPEPGQPGIL